MRTKIARKIRKDILRRGADIKLERMVFTTTEMKQRYMSRKDNGFGVLFEYKGHLMTVCGDDILMAFRCAVECLDDIDSWEEDSQ